MIFKRNNKITEEITKQHKKWLYTVSENQIECYSERRFKAYNM